MRRQLLRVVLGLLGLSALWALAVPTASAAPVRRGLRPAVRSALETLSASAGRPVRATVSPRSGVVSFLATAPGAPIPARGSTAEERARRFLDQQAGLFGVRSADELATLRVSPVDAVGMEHVRFVQTYRGIPVAGGEIGVHLRGEGVVAVHSKTLPDLSGVPTTPTVSADTARARALEAIARTADLAGVVLSTPRLEIFDRGHLGGPPPPPAWPGSSRRGGSTSVSTSGSTRGAACSCSGSASSPTPGTGRSTTPTIRATGSTTTSLASRCGPKADR